MSFVSSFVSSFFSSSFGSKLIFILISLYWKISVGNLSNLFFFNLNNPKFFEFSIFLLLILFDLSFKVSVFISKVLGKVLLNSLLGFVDKVSLISLSVLHFKWVKYFNFFLKKFCAICRAFSLFIATVSNASGFFIFFFKVFLIFPISFFFILILWTINKGWAKYSSSLSSSFIFLSLFFSSFNSYKLSISFSSTV